MSILQSSLILKKAYGREPFDEKLIKDHCIEMIAPHRTNRKMAKKSRCQKVKTI